MFLGTCRRCSLHGSSGRFLGKGARHSPTGSTNPCSSTAPLYDWDALSIRAERAQRSPRAFHTPLPGALLSRDGSGFLFRAAGQSDPGKGPVTSGWAQLSDLHEKVLLLRVLLSRELRNEAERQVPVLHSSMICAP